jgi:large subunit ribosomal protein L9
MAHIQVILTEALQGVGKIGDIVRVKAGFARNFLLPRAKALVANKDNQAVFAKQKAELEAKSAKARAEAEKVAAQHANLALDLARHASETGQLYGSIKAKDFAAELARKGLVVEASHVMLANAIKDVGSHTIKVVLHPEVIITVPVTVSRQSL